MTHRLPDTVEHWPLDRLIPYARNARTHADDQVAQIAAGETVTENRTYQIGPHAKGKYLVVRIESAPPQVSTGNDVRGVASSVTNRPADLRVTGIKVPAQNFSGEKATIERRSGGDASPARRTVTAGRRS